MEKAKPTNASTSEEYISEKSKIMDEVEGSAIDTDEVTKLSSEISEVIFKDKIEQLEKEVANLTDRLFRSAADADNMRKRLEKQIDDASKYSVSNFASDLINVVENFFRACESFNQEDLKNSDNFSAFYQGIELTRKDLLSTLEKNGIKRINPEIGSPYDHNFHQAVAKINDSGHKSGLIINVMQAGYSLSDRLLRPAMVSVSA